MKKFILASASPRRRSLLKNAGFKFVVRASSYHERVPRSMRRPSSIVKYLAREKALAVARAHPREWVLGADTLVYVDGQTVGKPKNAAHAKKMLGQLSGKWQKVYTGVALVRLVPRKMLVDYAVSGVKIRRLSEDDIKGVASKHLDKAGAYAIQEKEDDFVEKLEGDYDNVVGLPVKLVRRLLRLAL